MDNILARINEDKQKEVNERLGQITTEKLNPSPVPNPMKSGVPQH